MSLKKLQWWLDLHELLGVLFGVLIVTSALAGLLLAFAAAFGLAEVTWTAFE